jgi:preprotein translocase subunit SecA
MSFAGAQRGWPAPGVAWGEYPQQSPRPGTLRRRARLSIAQLQGFADAVAAQGVPATDVLATRLQALPALKRDPQAWLLEATVLAAGALAHNAGYSPHRQQLMAARVLLDERLAEVATGEGKTASIAMAAAVAALGGTPVHVVTANDYLAQRDAHALQPFFEMLRLRVGCVTQPMTAAQRRAAYGADVTYCTAKELAFDYLRDGLLGPTDLSPLEQRARRLAGATGDAKPVLRGLCMAILDEADTVLIDEARVPLVLSQAREATGESAFHRDALAVARRLAAGEDYLAAADGRRFELTGRGRLRLADWPVSDDPLLGHRAHREAAVRLALVALHVLQRDRDYVVRDGEVVLVDETTGRAAPGRAWSAGLHQLVEWKEGVAATRPNTTMTQITFQRFFPRYLRLAGASGTLGEARGELRGVYGLEVVAIAPRVPSRVRTLPMRLHADEASLWAAVSEQANALARAGRAVLIGTETVAQSEALSDVLTAQGLRHQVLNARQDQEESRLIAGAGGAGCVTVATSMAGRGTDIRCASDVLERGGLHIILCQANASPRIDRQFLGRAGRHGEPGSVQRMLAADTPLLLRWWPRWWIHLLVRRQMPKVVAFFTIRAAQWLESFTIRYERVRLARIAEQGERELAFSRRVHHEQG